MINDHLVSNKSDFRKLCKKRLTFIGNISSYTRNKIIVNKLRFLVKQSKAKNILLYIPFKKMEVNVNSLIKDLRKEKNINVYVPFIKDESFVPVIYRLPLKNKKYGIKEPNYSSKKVKIDLAIVPILGIDSQMKRVGFGAGMYDRFFDKINYRPTIVFTQLELCCSKKKLCDHYDIQADYIITY